MAEPIKEPSMNDPSQNPELVKKTSPDAAAPGFSQKAQPSLDPSGVWAKFLSQASGQEATPEEVNLFLQSLEKMFNVLVQQNQAAFKRSLEKLKDAQDGQ